MKGAPPLMSYLIALLPIMKGFSMDDNYFLSHAQIDTGLIIIKSELKQSIMQMYEFFWLGDIDFDTIFVMICLLLLFPRSRSDGPIGGMGRHVPILGAYHQHIGQVGASMLDCCNIIDLFLSF